MLFNHYLIELFAEIIHCPMCGKLLKEIPHCIPPSKICPDYHGVFWVTDDGPSPMSAVFIKLATLDANDYRRLMGDPVG